MRAPMLVLAAILVAPSAAPAEATGVHVAWGGSGYAVAFGDDATAPTVRWNGGEVAATPAPSPGGDADRDWFARLPAEATSYSIGNRSFAIAPRPAADATMRVAFVADMGRSNDSWAILDQIERANPDLVLVGGDIAYANGAPAKWDAWLDRVEPLASRVPFMTAMGNHETLCQDAQLDLYVCAREAQEYDEHFLMPNAPDRFYAFDWGPARFVALDTEAYHHDPALANATDPVAQVAFLDASLAARRDAWSLVYFHRPLYTSNTHDGPPDAPAVANLVPSLQSGGADLVLAGHEHDYERSWPLRDGEPQALSNRSGEGQGVVYVVSGGGGRSLYDRFDPQPAWSAFRSASFEFVLLTISPAQIHAQAIGEDGSVLDDFVVSRSGAPPSGPISESHRAPALTLGVALLAILAGARLRRARREEQP